MSVRSVVAFVVLVIATALFAPSLAHAQVCISDAVRSAMNDCSAAPAASSARGDDAPSHLMPAPHSAAPSAAAPSVPGIELDPHDAIAAAHAELRTRDLLEQEIQTLERMVDRGARGAHHAEYLARLADTEFELQAYWRAHARALDQEIFDAQSHDAAEATRLRTEQTEAETNATHARDAAVHAYARLVEEHPDYPTLDQVLFSLASGLDEGGDHEQARQVYLRLIRDFPASRFVPHAWLSFAEYYFDEADMTDARPFYERVLETPPESNPVYGYALYKLAWVQYNLEDFQGALTQFARLLDFTEQHPDAHDAASLARQVRRELVLPYARVGRPSQALAFFRRYASTPAQSFEMLESLAQLYEDTGQWPETIQVYHQLMSEQPASDSLCHWQSRVTSAVISSRPKSDQVIEVRRLVDVMNAFAQASHPDDSQTSCRSTTATILVELATAWHREAIGDGTQPGTNDPTTMRRAAALYELIEAELPDMGSLQYPEIDRRDWPTPYRVAYFHAELLWRMDDFGACGPAFDRVVALDPAGEYSADAAYAEVLCYDHLYEATYLPHDHERDERDPEAPPEPPRALTEIESGMVRAFERYLCTVPSGDERATVQYRLGRVYYDARHFEEASIAFRAVATDHAESDLGSIAANLHLDSLNAIYRRDGRASCVADLRADLTPLGALYCASAEARGAHEDLCPLIAELECETMRLDAEALARAGEHATAARRYVALARDHGECGRRDEMLWNAAIEFEAARLLGRAIQVRQTLVENFADRPLAQRAVYLIGANYHALAMYSSAADWYERFAREQPRADGSACTDADRSAGTCAIAWVALENAVFFRLGLGETDRARDDAALYERSYRRSRPRETASVVLALGAIDEQAGDWARVAAHDRAFLHDYGHTARPDEILRANVRLGRAMREVGHADQAEPFFRAALAVWSHDAAGTIARLPGTEDEQALWTAHAREAVSAAEYYLAENLFDAFRAIRFPHFSGQRTMSSVMRWSARELGPWLTRRFAALHAAETAYDAIAELGVPEWQIAAAERVGEMYRSIVDDVRAAPVPEEIENDDELYGVYSLALERVLDGSSAGPDQQWDTADDLACTPQSTEPSCVGSPLRQATARFEYCLTLATRVRWFDARSQQCEAELNAMDAAAYPLAAELRGTASYDVDAMAPPSAVALRDESDE